MIRVSLPGETQELGLGVEVVQVQLEDVFQMARQADSRKIEGLFTSLKERLEHLEELDETAVRGTLAVYLALRRLAEENRLDGMAIRCWPQFFHRFEMRGLRGHVPAFG